MIIGGSVLLLAFPNRELFSFLRVPPHSLIPKPLSKLEPNNIADIREESSPFHNIMREISCIISSKMEQSSPNTSKADQFKLCDPYLITYYPCFVGHFIFLFHWRICTQLQDDTSLGQSSLDFSFVLE